ncbi:FAD-binding oxidoreductase [Anaeromyxobacter oryzisoli]|uniref:FAD-binding oxidoreductase n=1 Tax=Anaeromyxobacter oryzisoli TaxID=2925408 RepID=UPI001F57AD0E|nr:FAD-binding oxidoreductase [Anaeromyxobacter sp. SG63]
MTLESWGRFPRTTARIVPLHWRTDAPFAGAGPFLPHGLGRSYGDECLNDGGVLIRTRSLDRFIALDEDRALLTCEAGVTLSEILKLVEPLGFGLPVVPGTKLVTVGGAIANDVHGKNHHRAGTFGAHVEELELLRSTGERIVCSRASHAPLFAATVGGLGLTGVIVSATIRLRRQPSPRVDAETLAIRDLREFFDLSLESDARFEYTVAWIDCLARGRHLGRGILHRGNPAQEIPPPPRSSRRLAVPFELPVSPLNGFTVRAFNAAYYLRHRLSGGTRRVPRDPFFFPLDGVDRWNRIYGRAGFFQFQCQLPPGAAEPGLREILSTVAAAGEGSFLAVLKNFGEATSPGLLSFPREGSTVALDFPNRGSRTLRLFERLHAAVREHGGRIYPAKDALMPADQFQTQHRRELPAFRAQLDPAFSSSLWRRVNPGE